MFVRTENFREFIKLYPVVFLLILIHIVVWLLAKIPLESTQSLIYYFVGINGNISQGEWWRLITPIITHISFSHLLFNTFSLLIFAPALERILGKGKFILMYFTTGIIANVATYLLENIYYTHVGASGSIFGLFGIYLFFLLYRKDILGRDNAQVLMTMVIIALVMTFVNSNINVVAHLAGIISGFVLSLFTIQRK
ncbi:rhomboid family intramembrane serine protease [Priestia endophytica]|uniref:rhomboid family intramembrane serine protease n=1 Tax=Priestia endophytica TaxID=135735 RepID=UPI000F52B2F8|nr:rhomboid family intramembrane serine protease [Priestia endophytica]MED4073856.1 rhomboid family intramembrane serine protease [Priestia endophytica]RPK05972.1 hypothetical protein FH5_01901 [Priestia endophytica]